MEKSVLITGASTGIGFATAVALQTLGYQVYACVRKPEDLDRLKATAPGIKGVFLDVTNSEQIQSAVENLRSDLESAHEVHLINNAGIAVPGPIEAIAIEDFKRQFDVNVFGLIEVTQAFLPWIRKTKGRIVNLSSVSGLSTSPFLGAYSASKFAVEAISDALRRELLGMGVKVILIEPGPTATPIWQKGLGQRDSIETNLRKDRAPIYREALHKFADYVEGVESRAIPVENVVKAIVHAIQDKNPPLRKIVTSTPDLVRTRLAQWLPASWLDTAIKKALISPK